MPCEELSAHALFGSDGWTTSRATSASGPLTFDQVAPPSMLRKTPAGLPTQTTRASDAATATVLTGPPSGPEEVHASEERRRAERRFIVEVPESTTRA